MESDKSRKLKLATETRKAGFNGSVVTPNRLYIEALEAEVDYLRLCHAARPKGKHDKNCTTCDHAEFRKTTAGRRMLDQPGECGIKTRLPHSFIDMFKRAVPEPQGVTKYTLAGCPFHSKVK